MARFLPDNQALVALARDYQQMADDGLLLDEPEPFEALLDRWCTLSGKARHHAPLERRSLKAADR